MGKPEIRFKGYTDEWEQRKLGDIYGSIGNAFVGTATPYYAEQGHFYLESNNVKDGQINHNSEIFINDEFYEKQKDKWLHTGDMVMVQSGHVGHAAVIPEELDNTAAHALIMFRNPKEEIEPYFLNYEYQTDKAKKKIENITTGNTIKHILASDMQEFVVDVPKYVEQKVIAGYFRNLDHLITLHQRKLDKLRAMKKSYLSEMFPQAGEKKPRRRFKGFTEDWEQRKFGDDNDLITGYPFESDKFSEEGIKLVRGMNVKRGYLDFSDDICMRWNSTDGLENYLLEADDILIQMDGALIGKSYAKIAEEQLPALLVQRVTRARTRSKDACTDFMYQAIQRDFLRYIEMNKTETAVPHLSLNDIYNFKIMVPCLEEQQQIGAYFSNIDNLITLHQRKLFCSRKRRKYHVKRD